MHDNASMNTLEAKEHRLDRLEFDTLREGDIVAITTGQDEAAWDYHFIVDTAGKWPLGRLDARTPDGEDLGEIQFRLDGCGRWTTPQQNPVQKQLGRAFTPYFDGLVVGTFLMGFFPGEDNRCIFDKPGQEISEIQLFRRIPIVRS